MNIIIQACSAAPMQTTGTCMAPLAAPAAPPAPHPRRRPAPLPAEYEELGERLRSATGLKVTMEGTAQKGKIVLSYSGQEELQRLWDLLGE